MSRTQIAVVRPSQGAPVGVRGACLRTPIHPPQFKDARSFARVLASLLCSWYKVRRGLPSLKALKGIPGLRRPRSHSGLVVPGLEAQARSWDAGFRSLGLRVLVSTYRRRGASPACGKLAFAARGHVAAQGWLVSSWCTWQLLIE